MFWLWLIKSSKRKRKNNFYLLVWPRVVPTTLDYDSTNYASIWYSKYVIGVNFRMVKDEHRHVPLWNYVTVNSRVTCPDSLTLCPSDALVDKVARPSEKFLVALFASYVLHFGGRNLCLLARSNYWTSDTSPSLLVLSSSKSQMKI